MLEYRLGWVFIFSGLSISAGVGIFVLVETGKLHTFFLEVTSESARAWVFLNVGLSACSGVCALISVDSCACTGLGEFPRCEDLDGFLSLPFSFCRTERIRIPSIHI